MPLQAGRAATASSLRPSLQMACASRRGSIGDGHPETAPRKSVESGGGFGRPRQTLDAGGQLILRPGGSLYSGFRLPLHGALQQVQGEVDGHFEQRLCCAAGGAGDCRL